MGEMGDGLAKNPILIKAPKHLPHNNDQRKYKNEGPLCAALIRISLTGTTQYQIATHQSIVI